MDSGFGAVELTNRLPNTGDNGRHKVFPCPLPGTRYELAARTQEPVDVGEDLGVRTHSERAGEEGEGYGRGEGKNMRLETDIDEKTFWERASASTSCRTSGFSTHPMAADCDSPLFAAC